MRLKKLGEKKIIENIAAMFRTSGGQVVTSIGDDAAVTRATAGKLIVSTIDTLEEGVHFERKLSKPSLIGEKLVNISVSDVAAMGGVALHCLISIALPHSVDSKYLKELYKGIKKACKEHGIALIGGNTSSSRSGITLNSAVFGEVSRNDTVLRSGARPGDTIFTTGTLGDSALGLKILKKQGVMALRSNPLSAPVLRHLRPKARSKEGAIIGQHGLANAMTDISDGLLTDLGHIAEASKVGAVVYAHKIPLSDALKKQIKIRPLDINLALSGGEDYELLFTVSPGKIKKVLRAAEKLSVPISAIGKITEDKGIIVLDASGKRLKTAKTGYEHFTCFGNRGD